MGNTIASLPPVLTAKFEELERRIRWSQLLNGTSKLVCLLVLAFVAAFVTDRVFGLSTLALRLWCLALLVGAIGIIGAGLVLPRARRLDALTLAGLVENRYPDLQERLSSVVSLTAHHQQAHGAEALITLLCEDASCQTAALNLSPVMSVTRPWQRLGLAVTLMVLAVVPAGVSSTYAYFGQRFFRAWFAPLVGYHLDVTPAGGAVAKGRPATITVKLQRDDDRVALPSSCFLVYRDASATRQAMHADAGQFTYTVDKVPGDLHFRIEAGELVSETIALTAVEPVELSEPGSTIKVTPPPYVNREVHPAQTSTANSDFSALQYSLVRFDFRFTRVPVALRFDWHKEGAQPPVSGNATVHWGSARQEAWVEVPAAAIGIFGASLIMEAEHGITTVHTLPLWKVWPDEPPVFSQLPRVPAPSVGWSEHDQARTATPHEAIALPTTVEDLVGIDRLEVEYRVNNNPSCFEELAKGDGKLSLRSETPFPLLGKVKEGDLLRFRLRAWDNRALGRAAIAGLYPEAALAPHVVYEPAPKNDKDQWYTLKITSQADPLHQQEIVAQRDEIGRRVAAIKKALRAERTQLEKVHLAAHSQPFVTPEITQTLGRARSLNADITKELSLLGREAMADPALLALAERAFDIAENEMGRTEQNLAKAGDKQLDAAAREEQLKQADQELVKALARLDDLAQVNERLAQDRLDQLRMEVLARQQEDLARRMKELTALGADKSKAVQDELALMRAEQDKIARELEQLAATSQLFKESLQKFRAGNAHQMARMAHDLAQARRQLTEAGEETLLLELKNKLAALALKQEDLAGKAERLGQAIKGKKDAAHFPEARAAADALKEAKVGPALQAQAKTHADLARWSDDLEEAILLGNSPRAAAQKLASMQERLRKDLADLGERLPRLAEGQVRESLLQVLATQRRLVSATARLKIPTDHPKAQAAHVAATDLVRQVEEYLKTRDGLASFNKMDEAVTGLRQLAASLPDTPPAQAKETPEEVAARQNAAKLRALAKEQQDLQDAVRKAVEELRGSRGQAAPDERLTKLIQQQQDLAARIQALAQEAGVAGAGMAKNVQAAAQAAQQAATEAQVGAFAKAQAAGEQASGKLRELGKDMAGKPGQEARELARRQEMLNEKWQELSRDVAAQQAQQNARRQELEQAAQKLTEDLVKLAQQTGSPEGMHGAKEAAQAAMDARKAMDQAAKKKDEGNVDQAKEMAQEAALKLDLAGQKADQAADQMQAAAKSAEENEARDRTGKAFKEGQDQVAKSQNELRGGPSAESQKAMQQAAAALKNAAQAAARQSAQAAAPPSGPNKSLKPGQANGVPGGQVTTHALTREMEKYLGKSWGELPGELRTRIVQDLRARYGDDYAPIIQRYFQQIADVPALKR